MAVSQDLAFGASECKVTCVSTLVSLILMPFRIVVIFCLYKRSLNIGITLCSTPLGTVLSLDS